MNNRDDSQTISSGNEFLRRYLKRMVVIKMHDILSIRITLLVNLMMHRIDYHLSQGQFFMKTSEIRYRRVL